MFTTDRESSSLAKDIKNSSFSTDLRSEIDTRVSGEVDSRKTSGRFFYTVGDYNLFLEEGIKVENLSNLTINEIPHAPKWCKGITNIRGNITPIVDMHIFLKTKKENKKTAKKQKLLMLEHKNYPPIIFQIDKLPEMAYLEECKKNKLTKNLPIWVKESYTDKNKILLSLNHNDLFEQLKNF